MAIIEVSVVPLGLSTASLSKHVAAVLEPVKSSGLNYTLTAMGTIIEGEIGEVMRCVLKMHEIPFGEGVQRVYTTVKIDDRRDKQITIESKVRSVMNKGR